VKTAVDGPISARSSRLRDGGGGGVGGGGGGGGGGGLGVGIIINLQIHWFHVPGSTNCRVVLYF